MRNKLTKEEFLNKSNKVHKNKYDYSLVEYKDSKYKIYIICKKHGVFNQTPNSHMSGKGCPECGNNHKVSTNDFINRCSLLHNNKYDYSITEYVSKNKPVKIICKEHGIFELTPQSHFFKKVGCKSCKGRVKTTDDFIKKSKIIHNDKYDYSLVDYTGNKNRIKIICKEHGIFEQVANYHLSGGGCSICGGKNSKTTNDFIECSNLIHNNHYDYSLVDYKNNRIKVEIICKEHGIFEQVPYSHISGSGCPSCNESKGEKKIKVFLDTSNIKYERQKKFIDCVSINSICLRFDFYIPSMNMCIEYDGEQHFNINEYFGGEKEFNNLKQNDEIKNKYCIENNISLIRIPYYDFNNIDNILINLK